MNAELTIPAGTTYEHFQGMLIRRDGWMCEKHPGYEWGKCPGGIECSGPGMPWMIVGREAIEDILNKAESVAVENAMLEASTME